MNKSYNIEDEKDRSELLDLIATNEAKEAKAAEENPESYAIVKEVRRLLSDNKTVLVLNKKGEAFYFRYFFLENAADNKQVWSAIAQKNMQSVYFILRVTANNRFFYKDAEGNLKEVNEQTEEVENPALS